MGRAAGFGAAGAAGAAAPAGAARAAGAMSGRMGAGSGTCRSIFGGGGKSAAPPADGVEAGIWSPSYCM